MKPHCSGDCVRAVPGLSHRRPLVWCCVEVYDIKLIIATSDYRARDKSRLQESELESESMMSSTLGVTPTPTPMESTSPTLDSPNTKDGS